MMNDGGDDSTTDSQLTGDLQDWDRPHESSSGRSDAQDMVLQQTPGASLPPKAQGLSPGAARFQGVARLLVGNHRGVDVVAQGSPIVRVLSFVGSVVSSFLCIFALVNPLMMLAHPIMWCVHFYQLIFSLSTLIFEAKPGWVHHLNMLESYKEILVENARFLTKCLGRGMFYIFQASLWACLGYSQPISGVTETRSEDRLEVLYHFSAIVLALYMLLLGIVHMLMHFGIMPSHYAISLNRLGRKAGGKVQLALATVSRLSSARSESLVASQSQGHESNVELSAQPSRAPDFASPPP